MLLLNAGESEGGAFGKEPQNVVGHLHLLAIQFSEEGKVRPRGIQFEVFSGLLYDDLWYSLATPTR